jgi:uncharacterized cupredoxin-like copper-binding protein
MSRSTTVPSGPGRQALIVLAAGLALALTACGKNQATEPGATAGTTPVAIPSSATPSSAIATTAGSPTTTVGSPTTTGLSTPAPEPARAPIANAVTVTTPGMRYDVSGSLRPGIAAITLTNTDDVAHMMAVARLKDGVTLTQVTDALAQSEEAAAKLLADSPDTSYGTPSIVGAGQSTTVTALDLPAGHYALICFLPGSDGKPHWQMGMIDELTVAGDKATERPPTRGTITIDDQGISLPAGFTGNGTFEVVNNGKAPHGFSLAELDQGTGLADFAGHVGMAENSGQPVDGGGGVLVGGVDVLAPGQSAFLTLALRPGHYGYLSPSDMTGPQLPAQHGEFDVR